MKALLSASLFLTLLSQATPANLFCRGSASNEKYPLGISSCKPYLKHKMCSSKIVDFPLDGQNRNSTTYHIEECMSRERCHIGKYTASFPDGGYIYIETKCCNDKIGCNKLISVPKQETRALNEMQCPGCLNTTEGEPCTSETKVSCREHENKCISYTGRLRTPYHTYPKLSFKGCASTNLCDLLTGDSEEGQDLLEPLDPIQAECSSAEYPKVKLS